MGPIEHTVYNWYVLGSRLGAHTGGTYNSPWNALFTAVAPAPCHRPFPPSRTLSAVFSEDVKWGFMVVVFINWGPFPNVLVIRALPFGVHIRATDFWKPAHGS